MVGTNAKEWYSFITEYQEHTPMILIRGEQYVTTIDAARELGVSTKTLRQYIRKGIIPPPPEIQFGIRILRHFPPDYMKTAKESLTTCRNGNAIR